MNSFLDTLPETFRNDIQKATAILKSAGCSEVYIFGSLAEGDFSNVSDIDIAVKGLPNQLFFKLGGRLMMELSHNVDIIELDDPKSRFSQHILERGRLIRVD